MSQQQTEFLDGELFSLALRAIAQRGRLYSDNATERKREDLHRDLKRKLQCLTARYEKTVSEADHLANIDFLSKTISDSHADILLGGRLRIGTAQKALNLHLKYMWCIERIQMPPHCPFDSIVLAKIPDCSGVRWTYLDSLDEYKKVIQRAKLAAGDTPLAVWELNLYNDAWRDSSALSMATGSEVP